MHTRRIHITGASGAGVTTFGRALASEFAVPHHDTDDYYWLPTHPTFAQKRAVEDRLRLMDEMFVGRNGWVLSGSLDGWGDRLIPHFDMVVFVTAPTSVRVRRLEEREARRFGADAVAQGSWRYDELTAFLDWAAHYDDDSREGRSAKRHEAWLHLLPCPVLRADGTAPTAAIVSDVAAALDGRP
jgi:adenylate kinase family enzyme